MHCRNAMFKAGIKKERSFALPIISIGNITVGGTGKTPMAEFIIKNLSSAYKLASLSRGYRRETKGYEKATILSSYKEIGDEPKQIKTKFPHIDVAVCEKRVEGVERLLKDNSKIQAIILDDAYQHRYIKPSFSILLVDYNRPIWNDFVFPAGRLRESAQGKKRADAIVITKCPSHLSVNEKQDLCKRVKPLPHQKVFFASISYGKIINCEGTQFYSDSCIALSGIAKPESFFSYVEIEGIRIEDTFVFPDHYNFTNADIDRISQLLETNTVITTEKDFMRLSERIEPLLLPNIYYIPIETKFLFNEGDMLINSLINHINSF